MVPVSGLGHLLGRAMDAAPQFAHWINVNGHDFAPRIVAFQGVCGNGVGRGIAELSGNHPTIAHVIVGVRRDKVD